MFARIAVIAALATLAACGNSAENRQLKETRAKNLALQAEAEKTAKTVQVAGSTFRVAVITSESYALVKRTAGTGSYTVPAVEAAARLGSGCNAEFEGGILEFLTGDLNSTDLEALSARISKFNGWRTNLSC